MQHRGVEVVHVHRILHRVVAELVRGAEGDAGLDAAARQPDGERARVMVAAQELRVVPALVHGGAAELAAPDHEGRVQEPALLQVLDQGGRGLVDLAAQRRQAVHDVVALARPVVVPAAVVELHEAHAPLHEPPRQQAVVAERPLARLDAVHLLDRFRLLRHVGQVGDARLHPEGQLVGSDARVDLRIAGHGAVGRVHLAEHVEGLAAVLGPHPGRVGQEQDGIALGPELHSLIDGGQESAPPARLAAVGSVLAREQHHETRQVLRLGSEAVGHPRPHAGATHDLVARVHEDLGRGVVELRGVDRAHDRELVRDLAQVWQEVGDLRSGLPALLERVRRAQELGCALDEGEALALHELVGDRLAVVLAELGLLVEEVHL